MSLELKLQQQQNMKNQMLGGPNLAGGPGQPPFPSTNSTHSVNGTQNSFLQSNMALQNQFQASSLQQQTRLQSTKPWGMPQPPQSSVCQQNVKKKKVTVHELESRFNTAMDIVNSRKKFEYWTQNDRNISSSGLLFISLEIDDEGTQQQVDAITLATYTYAVSFNLNVGLLFDQRFIVLMQQIFMNPNVRKVIHDYTGLLE